MVVTTLQTNSKQDYINERRKKQFPHKINDSFFKFNLYN